MKKQQHERKEKSKNKKVNEAFGMQELLNSLSNFNGVEKSKLLVILSLAFSSLALQHPHFTKTAFETHCELMQIINAIHSNAYFINKNLEHYQNLVKAIV